MDLVIPALNDTDVDSAEEIEPFPWAAEIAKDLTLGATQTAGFGLGALAVGAVIAFGPKLLSRFRSSEPKMAPVYNITDLPQVKEN